MCPYDHIKVQIGMLSHYVVAMSGHSMHAIKCAHAPTRLSEYSKHK